MSKEKYSWWEDPKNKEIADRMSWWDHPGNKEYFKLSISVIKSGDYWVATCNDDTKVFLGDKLHGCGQGKTKDEAIRRMFDIIRITHDFSEQCRLNYQRFVPFRCGDWRHIGGKWFIIYGINIYFRYGKGMKGGAYIPFTKLNISISSDWIAYKNWKKKQKK